MRPQNLLLLLFVLAWSSAFAQKEWSNWYFNGASALTFTDNNTAKSKIKFIDPPPDYWYSYLYNSYKGTAYSDPQTGKMRFLMAGRFAYDRNYDMIESSLNLRACPGDKYSFQIIPFQNNPDKFYIVQFQDLFADILAAETGLQVRCPNAIGLGYSVLDLSRNNGLGEFTSMNTVLQSGIPAGITQVRHANGRDTWVVVHGWNSSAFYAYLFTDAGVSAPVVSAIGPIVQRSNPSVGGTLAASHNGKMIAAQLTGNGTMDVYDFDNSSGRLTGAKTLSAGKNPHSMVFSPDDTKLYYLGDYQTPGVYQFDLDVPYIQGSLVKIADDPHTSFYDMALGPDGRIYIAGRQTYDWNTTQFILPVINCPNLAKYACHYDADGFYLPPNYSYSQFPALINDYVKQPKAPRATEFSLGADTAICFGSHKLSAPEGWQYYKWNNGATTREITVTEPGLYYVLAGDLGFSCPTSYGAITLTNAARKPDLGKDTVLCPGTPYLLRVPSNFTDLLWSDGTTDSEKVVTTGNTFMLKAKDENGCTARDTIMVGFKYYPRADFGRDTTLCDNQTLLLQLEPQAGWYNQQTTYKWQDGSVKDTFRVKTPGTYWGQVRYQGCTVSDTIRVGYVTADYLSLGADTTLCTGDSLRLTVPVANAAVRWSTGEQAPQIVVRNSGTYWVRVDNGLCTVTDTIQVFFQPKPVLRLGPDTSLCANQTLTLNPAVPGASLRWQDGSTSPTFVVKNNGLYAVTATVNGCSVKDSVRVSLKALPPLDLGRDTTVCTNESLLLNARHPAVQSYLWSNGSVQPEQLVTAAGTYAVQVTGTNGCKAGDTIQVAYAPLPVFSLGRDTVLCEEASLPLQYSLAGAGYLWNTGSQSNSMTIRQAGLYWLQVTQGGCSRRDSLLVDYKPLPVVSLGRDTTLCEDQRLLLDATQANADYQWQDNSTAPTFFVSAPGTYSVRVTMNGCVNTGSVKVAYKQKPRFSLGNDTTLCTGLELLLDPGIRNAAFQWQNGSAAPVFTVKEPGIYQLTATNECGSVQDAIVISQGVCELLMPTAFTPNGDGLNDLFRIKYPGFIKTFSMTIYNRWGEVVFRSADAAKGWDGRYKSLLQPTGNYVWQIALTTKDGKQQTAKGAVLLIR